MKTSRSLCVGAAFLAVVGTIVLLAAGRGHARGESATEIEGTGKFDSQVVRTSEALDPPCVSLVARVGQVAFTGLISNELGDGKLDGLALRDACTVAVQGTTRQTYDLRRVTVAGRTGHLRIEADGVFEGDATTPPGARSRYILKIRGIAGDLAGAEGEGQSVGTATGVPGEPASSSNTYQVRIRFK